MFNKVLIKPVELEYVQFTDMNKDMIYSIVSEQQINIHHSFDKYGKPCLLIPTSKCELICHVGDYIIKDLTPKDWCKFICCDEKTFKSLMSIFDCDVF